MNQSVAKQTLSAAKVNEQAADGLDLAEYLDLFIGNRWLIAALMLVVTLLGTAYAFVATPIYQADILVQVEDSANSSANIMGNLAGAFDLKSAATAEIEILRSRLVVTRAVNNARLDLTVEPQYFPLIGRWIARRSKRLSQPGLLGFGGYVWGNEDADLGVFTLPKSLEGEQFLLTAVGDNRFHLSQPDAGLNLTGAVGQLLQLNSAHGLIEVRVDRLSAKAGAKFVVKRSPLLDTVEKLQRAITIVEKGKQSGIIGVSLEGADPSKTALTLNEIGREYIRQNVERKSAEAEKSLVFLEKQLPEMKVSLEEAESKYNALRNSRATVDLGEEAKSILQQSVLSQTRLVELKQKRDDLLTRYQSSNPLVEAVDQQIRTVNNEIASVNTRIKRMPGIEQDVLRLTRDVKVNTDLYTSLLNSAQQLRLVKASKVGNARLLDEAAIPLHPVRPQRVMIVVLAAIAGLFIGIIAAFSRRALFGGVEDPHEIEQLLGLIVTAAIPHSSKQETLYADVQARTKKVSVLALDSPRDSAVESLRSLRTALQFLMLAAKNKIVLITGPTPGVGKSFVSVNLAAVLASSGKKVVLLDADLRKGYLNSYFGLERSNGLSEVIAGELSFADAVHKSVLENLDFISTGTLPPRPAELLGLDSFVDLLKKLTNEYDLVIVDTAPVLAVSDAMVVAPHAGTIFNVVRGNVSSIGEIEESVKRLNHAGNLVAGVIFNGLNTRLGSYAFGSKYGKYRFTHYEY